MLVALGYNRRKLFMYYSGNLKTEYWKAHDNLTEEQFKRPSSKRLENKVNKRKISLLIKKIKKNISINKRAVKTQFLVSSFFTAPIFDIIMN